MSTTHQEASGRAVPDATADDDSDATSGTLPDVLADDEQRRTFLLLLATDGELLGDFTKEIGEDVMPYVVRALALELCKVSVAVATEVEERLSRMELGMGVTGAMVAGLTGMKGIAAGNDGADADAERFRSAMFEDGRRIRAGAGLG